LAYLILSELYDPGKAFEWQAHIRKGQMRILRIRAVPGQILEVADGCQLWVSCGRRPGKNFLSFLQHWSGAVGLFVRPMWPLALMALIFRMADAYFKLGRLSVMAGRGRGT
jgi:hypothetical protein